MAGYQNGLLSNFSERFNSGMNNPLTHLGMGIMANSQPRYSTNIADLNGGGIGQGLLSGAQSYQQHQNQQGLLGIRQQQMDNQRQGVDIKRQAEERAMMEQQRKQQQLMQRQEAMQGLIARLPENQQAEAMEMARADPDAMMQRFFPKPEASPSSQREYEIARADGSFNGSFIDWLNAAADRNRPPPNPDVSALARTQGLIAQQTLADKQYAASERRDKAAAAGQAKSAGLQDRKWKSKFVLEEARGLARMVTEGNTGRVGLIKQYDPQSETSKLQLRMQPILANLVADAIADARRGSPTGSTGYGSLSAPEVLILQTQVADLKGAQFAGPEEMKHAINGIIRQYERLQEAVDQDIANLHGGQSVDPASNQKPVGLLNQANDAPEGTLR